jgi:hypothetical protein
MLAFAPPSRKSDAVLRTGIGVVAAMTMAMASACGAAPVALHAPSEPPATAREKATRVELLEIALGTTPDPVVSKIAIQPPGPLPALTRAMRAELGSRALAGGETAGYQAKCHLDRFALRTDKIEALGIALLYVDLGCTVTRASDGVPVWRGALRGRGAAAGKLADFSDDDQMWQAFADRTMSDVSRELASDLAIGVLGLTAKPSQRAFANEEEQRLTAGVDDTPFGAIALAEDADAAREVVNQLRDPDPILRAAAWNAIAMASAPDRPWVGGVDTIYDDDAYVRFFQYKALARQASASALADLKRNVKRENQSLLEESLKDSLASGGIGLRRQPSIETAATKGATTRP